MLVLFDHGTPAPLISFLRNHTVKKAKDLGWDTLSNGALLKAAEEAAFGVLLTTDKNIRYQQDLTARRIAIVVLGNPQWPVLRLHIERVVDAVDRAKPGTTPKSRFQIPSAVPFSASSPCGRVLRGICISRRKRTPGLVATGCAHIRQMRRGFHANPRTPGDAGHLDNAPAGPQADERYFAIQSTL